jgi:hypothetical protein
VRRRAFIAALGGVAEAIFVVGISRPDKLYHQVWQLRPLPIELVWGRYVCRSSVVLKWPRACTSSRRVSGKGRRSEPIGCGQPAAANQPKDVSKEHKIERSLSGGYVAFWRERPIYEKGRMKKFPTEEDARAFLAQCDEAGKIIHAT